MESYVEQGAGADSIEQIGFGGARRTKKKHRGLTVFQLKVIGAVALALSAGSTTIVPLFFGSDVNNMTSLTAMVLSEVISWFAIPIYAWLLVQGFRETHSRVAYGLRLFILAVVSMVFALILFLREVYLMIDAHDVYGEALHVKPILSQERHSSSIK